MNPKYNQAAAAIKAFGTDAATQLLTEVAPHRHKDLLRAAITAGLRDGDIDQELTLISSYNRACDLADQLFSRAKELGAPDDFGDDGFFGWVFANIDNLVARHPDNKVLREIRSLHARRLMVD